MPVIIRRVMGETFENFIELQPDEWKIREQVEALQDWLEKHRYELDTKHEWVADIGFCLRRDARGGGPPIYRRMMEMCLEANLEIYLSEYQGEA